MAAGTKQPALYTEIDKLQVERDEALRLLDGERAVNRAYNAEIDNCTRLLKQADSERTEVETKLAEAENEHGERLRAMRSFSQDLEIRLEEALVNADSAQAALAEAMGELRQVCVILGGTESQKSAIDLAHRVIAEATEMMRKVFDHIDSLANVGMALRIGTPAAVFASIMESCSDAVNSTTLAAEHMARDERMRKALETIRDYVPEHGLYSETIGDMRIIARQALASKEGENG